LKEVVIHIGYPKTATTTLQEAVFLNLHERKLINYLGRTQKSTHTKTGRSQFNGHDWVVDIRREFLFEKTINRERIELKSDLINVISDEDLTIHPDFHLAQFGVKRNPLVLAERLKNLLGEADKITVLLTLRNQADLIPSCYLQKFRFLLSSKMITDFQGFVFNKDGTLRKVTQDVFDFKSISDYYRQALGAKMEFLFFEDLKSDKENFLQSLSNILRIDKTAIVSLLETAHYRNREKNKIGKDYTSVIQSRGIGKLIEFLMGRNRFMIFINKFWYMRFSVFRKYIRKCLVRDIPLKLPECTLDQKELIRSAFSEMNFEFADSYGLDKERMKLYGYFK
jgi:hypothetical protein